MKLTDARSGIARSNATRSGYPALQGFKVRTFALSNVARSGATRSNYTSNKTFITVGGIPVGTIRPGAGVGVLIESLTINDSLSSTPTTGTLTAYGWVPVEGADVVITLGSINNRRRDFGGTILRTKHRYVGDKPVARNMLYDCQLIDYAWGLQKRKVSDRMTATTVGAIAASLMTRAPAGYTLEVAPDIATVAIDEITFTEQNLDDAIGQLVKRAGGDWQCDYLKVVRLFFTDTAYAPPSIVNTLHKSMAGITWDRDLSQVVTRVYVDAGGSDALEAIPVGATMIPVGTAAWYPTVGGTVLAGPQRVKYASVSAGGGGSLIGPGAAPTSAVNALVVPGTGVTPGTHNYAVTYRTAAGETIPSPVATVSVGVFAPPTAAPTAGVPTSAGPGPDPGTHEYAITYQVSTGETTPGPRTSAATTLTPPPTTAPTPTAGSVGAGPDPGSHDYAVSFVTPVGETTPGPIGGAITVANTPLPGPGPCTANAATVGGAVDMGAHVYAATFVTAYGETTIGAGIWASAIMGPGTKVPNPTNGPQCTPNTSHAGNSQPIGTTEYFCYSYLASSGETLWSNYGNAVVGTYSGGGPCAIDVTYIASPDSRVTGIAIYHSLNPGWANSWIKETTVPNANGTYGCGFYGAGGQNPPTTNTTPGTDGTPLQTIPIRSIPTGPTGVTARKLYRSPVGGGDMRLIATLANNSSTAYDDTTADAARGALAPASNTAFVTTAVALSDIPRGATGSGTTARNLYRRSGGAGLRFLDQIANNSSSTYTDTKANAALGVAPPSANTAYLQQIPLSAIPIGGSVVTGRKLYRTKIGNPTLYLLAALDNVVTTYLDTTPDASLGAAAPATNAAAAAQVNLSAIPVGAPTVLSRVIYRSAAGLSQLRFLTTIANNVDTTWTDVAADAVLGANAPTADTSSLTQPQGNVLAGSTSIPCASVAAFPPGGGWVLAGSQVMRYTGISGNNLIGLPASGPGSVASPMSYNTTIVAAPTLLGIPASGVGAIRVPIVKGDPVDLFVQEDDVPAQTALAAQLGGGDGIVEDEIQDRRLSSTEAHARARARLAQLAERDSEGKVGLITVAYTCRDTNTRAGATVSINLGPPINLRGEFLIQRVMINQFGIPHLPPTYTVEASSVRFTFEELLRVLKDTAA